MSQPKIFASSMISASDIPARCPARNKELVIVEDATCVRTSKSRITSSTTNLSSWLIIFNDLLILVSSSMATRWLFCVWKWMTCLGWTDFSSFTCLPSCMMLCNSRLKPRLLKIDERLSPRLIVTDSIFTTDVCLFDSSSSSSTSSISLPVSILDSGKETGAAAGLGGFVSSLSAMVSNSDSVGID